MDKILLINACIRPGSRTLRLAKHLLSRLDGTVEEVNLEAEDIRPLNSQSLKYRQELLAAGKFEDPMLRHANQFKAADIIVIAAPYYDLSFPSSLKVYFEAVACVGLTFFYDENEVAQTLCRAKKLYYVSTGGAGLKKQFGFEYVKAMVQEFYHIPEVRGFFAENLDLLGSDPEAIMARAVADLDVCFQKTVFHKLVRDKIPQIIAAQGETPVFRVLEDKEYTRCLEEKLDEEVKEYYQEKNLEELADVLEVAFSLADNLGYTREALLAANQKKHDNRGGFKDRIFLISKE